MKKTLLLFSLLCCLLAGSVKAQMDYTVSYPTSTFTALTGGTAPTLTLAYPADLAASQGVTTSDEGAANNVTLPFTFKFNGVDYTTCHISTNGFLSFGTALGQITAYSTNSLTSGPYTSATNDGRASRPLIAPLWDDLDGPSSGYISYQTSGTAPNRVFTVQWLNAKWDWQATSAGISFQAKLYETTNVIEFVYRQQSGSLSLGATASIGLANVTTGSTDFLSFDGVTSATTTSFRSESAVVTKPATNFTIRFTPTPTPAVDAALKQLVSSPLASCYNTPQSVTYTIVNRGTTPIAPGAATLSVVLTGANTGTYQVANTRTLAIYQTEDLTISTLNLNNAGSTTITATVALASDSRSSNDALTNTVSTTRTRSSFPVHETFAVNPLEFGWLVTLAGSQTLWRLQNSASFDIQNNTTPITPITGVTDNGFLLFMANNVIGNGNGFRSVIYSNCIELPSGEGQRNISFYMTRDGYTNPSTTVTSADSLYVVYSEDKAQTWKRLQGFGRFEAGIPFTWRRYEVNLNSLAGKTVHLGFEGVSKGGNAFALDSITVNATVTCTNPTAQTVTGGGSYCAGGTGVAIGLANSETGVTYQLKRGTTDVITQSGTTGQSISFGNQTTAGTYTVVATRITGGCTANMTGNAVVTVVQAPTTANAGPDQTGAATCGQTSVTLAANAPTVGTGAWSIVNGTGGSITTPSSPTSTFSGTAGSSYTLRWTVSNSPCTASTDDVVITFNALPTISLGTINSVNTGATSFSLPYSNTTGSPNQYSISAGTSTAMPGFAAVSNAALGTSPISVTIPASAANTYDFNLTVRNSTTGCASTNVPFTLTVTAAASAPTITSFSPLSAKPGDAVTITGTGFNTTAANNIVFFGATRATVTAATATSMTATVPTGATYAPISVLNTATVLSTASRARFNPIYAPAKTALTTADFLAKIDFTTGNSPSSVAIGDLDGDGKPDLAVANYSSNTVSVFRNTGTSGSIAASSFAAKADFTTGGNPISVAIGDLDGDGKPDLVVANTLSNTVSVLRNTGTAGTVSFAAKVDFSTGANPYSVAIGDLDGDGKPDLAVANASSASNSVSVLRNTSSSSTLSFDTKIDFATGTAPSSVAIGDLDGDGKPDLAVVLRSVNSVSVLRNTSSSSTLSFETKIDFTTGNGPQSVTIGDLDGDGKPDLATANATSNTVSVLRNTSSSGSIAASSFAEKVDFTTANNPQSVAMGDLDGDGKPDLATANTSSNTASVLRNTSTAAGSVSFAAKADFTPGANPYSVAIGDLDGDGKPDLAVANYSSNTVSIFRNAGVITTTGTLMPFQTCSGVPSNEQSFTVSGSNLTGDITVSVSTGVQVSQTSGGSYGSSVTLTPINGSVGSTPIFVRLPATTVPSGGSSSVSGVINVTSPGATSRTVSFGGSVVPFPSITLGTISSVSTTATSFSIPYSALTSADQYSITTGTPTAMPNFSAVTDGDFPEGNFINVPIPAGAANTYDFNLTVRNSTTGCVSATVPFRLTVTAPTLTTLTLSTATNPTNCTGTPNGSIAFTSTGYTAGSQTLSYKKDNEAATLATVAITADGSFTLTGLGAGVYSDFAIGSTTATGNRELVLQTTLPQFTVRSNSPQCERSGLSLESTVTNAAFNTTFTYAWTGPNGFTAATASATISSLLPVNAGTYNLLVTNTQTGCSDTKSLTVVVFPLPAIPSITASSMQLCKGESVLLTGTCSATTDIFRWTTPPLLGNSVASLSNVNERTITTPGVYKGLCESKDGCASDEVSINITERSNCSGLNFITVTPSKTAICPGGSVQLTASGCAGGTLTWIGGATPQTGTSITVSPTISTQYFVQCSAGGSGSVIVAVAQPTIQVPNNIVTGQDWIKATQTITSDKKIGDATFTPAPSVLYEAGSSITLLPGFVAEKWSTFKAEIKGCN